VSLLLLFSGAISSSTPEKMEWQYLIALGMAYGHIVGAAVFSVPHHRFWSFNRIDRLLIGSFSVVSILVLLSLYASALQVEKLRAPLLVAVLAVSLWHTIENDLELAHAYRTGMQLGAIRFDRSSVSWIVGAFLVIGSIGLSTPSGAQLSEFLFGRPLLPFVATLLDDFIVFVVFYHAVSWIVFLLDRARARGVRESGGYARLKRQLASLHLGPLVPLIALSVWFEPIYLYVAAPGLYLFFSILHTIHTASMRGFTRAQAA
jgi:branched-subunit amino acid transport protein AzlD